MANIIGIGCGDEWDGTEPNPCDLCHCYEGDGCECQPCDDCSELTQAGALTKGLDNRTRCPECHLEADLKIICRERPVFVPPTTDLRTTVEQPPVSMGDLVFGGQS